MRIEKLLNMDNVSLDMEATHEGLPAKDIFCSEWSNAKKGIELVATIVKNPVAKWVALIVISLGDSISEKICPTNKG